MYSFPIQGKGCESNRHLVRHRTTMMLFGVAKTYRRNFHIEVSSNWKYCTILREQSVSRILFYLIFGFKDLVTNYPARLYGPKGHDLHQPEELNSEVEHEKRRKTLARQSQQNILFGSHLLQDRAKLFKVVAQDIRLDVHEDLFLGLKLDSCMYSRQLTKGRSSQANTCRHVYFIWVKHSYWR